MTGNDRYFLCKSASRDFYLNNLVNQMVLRITQFYDIINDMIFIRGIGIFIDRVRI